MTFLMHLTRKAETKTVILAPTVFAPTTGDKQHFLDPTDEISIIENSFRSQIISIG